MQPPLSTCLRLPPLYVCTAGELVLWGATLWDPRVPAPLHTFDQLSSNAGGAGGIFHPNGGEIILNSEVGAAASAAVVPDITASGYPGSRDFEAFQACVVQTQLLAFASDIQYSLHVGTEFLCTTNSLGSNSSYHVYGVVAFTP
jgi:hypothetical protein